MTDDVPVRARRNCGTQHCKIELDSLADALGPPPEIMSRLPPAGVGYLVLVFVVE